MRSIHPTTAPATLRIFTEHQFNDVVHLVAVLYLNIGGNAFVVLMTRDSADLDVRSVFHES